MRVRFRFLVLVTAILALGHFAALFWGMYRGKVWIDMPLHLVGGILLGLIGAWMVRQPSMRQLLGFPSRFLEAIFIVFVALFGSLVWEVFEYLLWIASPESADTLKWFSPTVSDVLSDISFGFLGGAVLALIHFLKRTKLEQFGDALGMIRKIAENELKVFLGRGEDRTSL